MTVENNKQLGAFDKLLGELETMTKALPAPNMDDDNKIATAAGEGGEDDEDKDKLDADGKPMAKSFQVTLADGSVVEAEDGTELVKSLLARIDGTEDTLAKALGSAVGLIKAQGEALAANTALVKSLQSKVAELSGEGRGRKTVVSVHEKPGTTLVKSESEGMTHGEFMAKSNAAFTAGRISGKDFTVIDVSLRSNVAIDPALVSKVLA